MNRFQICLVLVACCSMMVSANKGSYKFGYGVNDPITGDVKEQQESKDCDQVTGYYKTLEADGLMRTVSYSSHPLTGFMAKVSRDPVPALGVKTVAYAAPKPAIAYASPQPAIAIKSASILNAGNEFLSVTPAAPIMRTAEIIEPARIATPMVGLPAAKSWQSIHRIDHADGEWMDGERYVPASVELKAASIEAAPAFAWTAPAAPLLRAQYDVGPQYIAAAAPAPLVETKSASSIVHGSSYAAAVTAAPLLRAQYNTAPLVETKLIPSIGLAPSTAIAYNSALSSGYQYAAPQYNSAAVLSPYGAKFIAATASPLEPCDK